MRWLMFEDTHYSPIWSVSWHLAGITLKISYCGIFTSLEISTPLSFFQCRTNSFVVFETASRFWMGVWLIPSIATATRLWSACCIRSPFWRRTSTSAECKRTNERTRTYMRRFPWCKPAYLEGSWRAPSCKRIWASTCRINECNFLCQTVHFVLLMK